MGRLRFPNTRLKGPESRGRRTRPVVRIRRPLSSFRPFSVIDTAPHVNVTLFIAVTTADVSTHWTTLASPGNASFFGVRGHRTVTDLARADFT